MSIMQDDGMRHTTFWRPVGLPSVSLSVQVPLYCIALAVIVTVKKDGVGEKKLTIPASTTYFTLTSLGIQSLSWGGTHDVE